MKTIDKIELWKSVSNFYRGLIEQGQDLMPQARLVDQLGSSEYGLYFHPTLSHGSLCLSSASDYDESQRHPMISITYKGDQKFEVEYWKKPTVAKGRTKRVYEEQQLWEALKSYFVRYEMEVTDDSI